MQQKLSKAGEVQSMQKLLSPNQEFEDRRVAPRKRRPPVPGFIKVPQPLLDNNGH